MKTMIDKKRITKNLQANFGATKSPTRVKDLVGEEIRRELV